MRRFTPFTASAFRTALQKAVRTRAFLICFGVSANLLSSHCARAEEFHFGHQITLHPITSLASIISFVPADGEELRSVRALMLLDGELLAVPLVPEADGHSFRGTFPTPRQTLSYRFQVIRSDGAAKLSQSFESKPECRRLNYQGDSLQVKKALSVQQQRERLRVSKELLAGFVRRLQQ